jgi:nitronate monooxygenase
VSQVRTVDEAKRSAACGVDVIVAQGTEAGGHTGLISTLLLVPAIVDAVDPIPVVAAGGVADARGVAAALLLGADGVWMGTRFLATFEAASSPWIRERILRAGAGDTVFTDVFDIATGLAFPPGVHTRSLRNSFTDRWHGREQELEAWTDEQRADYLGQGVPTEDQGPLLAGEAVGLISDLEPAGDLVRRIAREVDTLLRELPPRLLD